MTRTVTGVYGDVIRKLPKARSAGIGRTPYMAWSRTERVPTCIDPVPGRTCRVGSTASLAGAQAATALTRHAQCGSFYVLTTY